MWVVAVLREWENRGIGRCLMRLVEGWLGSEGCEHLWLTTAADGGVRARKMSAFPRLQTLWMNHGDSKD